MTKIGFLILPMFLTALIFSSIVCNNPVKADESRVSRIVEWQPNGDLIAVGGIYDIWLYNSKMEEVNHIQLNTPNEVVDVLAWNSTGTQLAILTQLDIEDSWKLQIWRVDPFQSLMSYEYEGSDTFLNISQISWNSSGDLIALGFGNKLEVRNTTDATLIFEIPDLIFEVTGLAWRPNTLSDDLLVVTHGSMQLFNGRTGSVIATFSEDGDFGNVIWSPSGNFVAVLTYGLGNIEIWNIEGVKIVTTLAEHVNAISDLAWNEAGLVSSSYDGTIYLWDLATGKPKDSLKVDNGVTSFSWNPDNDAIVYGNLEGLPVIVPIPFPN